jgi:hypothetical protein
MLHIMFYTIRKFNNKSFVKNEDLFYFKKFLKYFFILKLKIGLILFI